MSAETEEPERVGYRRPPRRTRFRPGCSGNPRGLARPAPVGPLVMKELSETVVLTDEKGAKRTFTKLELAVRQLVNRAASGDRHATLLVFSLMREEHARRKTSQPRRLDEADDVVIADLVRRLTEPQ